MPAKKIIVCVCRGNILRSAVAEKLISQQLIGLGLSNNYEVVSRSIQGTIVETRPVRFPNLTYYTQIYQQLKPILEDLHIDLSTHQSTPIDQKLASEASTLLAMDKQTKNSLMTLFPKLTEKIILFSDLAQQDKDITDVIYDERQTYRVKAVEEIQDVLSQGFSTLLKLVGD